MSTRGRSNVAIYAYGSLLTDPGAKIAFHIMHRIPLRSPWPIEYARRAAVRGGGPTLVLHDSGRIVQGQLFVTDIPFDKMESLRMRLWEREGRPPAERIKVMRYGGFERVLYCDLESNLDEAHLNPDSLARFALESMAKSPERNAVRYLADNIAAGVITPLTYAYRDALLRLAGAADLLAAEKKLLKLER